MKNQCCRWMIMVFVIALASSIVTTAQTAPLQLVGKIRLPALHDGVFDHFGKDASGNRLFLTAEANGTLEVFDAKSNKHIHAIRGLKSPHALVYGSDINKLFVVDGDASEIKVYDGKHNIWCGTCALNLRSLLTMSPLVCLAQYDFGRVQNPPLACRIANEN